MVVVQVQRYWPVPAVTSRGVSTMLPTAFGTVDATVTTPRPSLEIVTPDTYFVAPGKE